MKFRKKPVVIEACQIPAVGASPDAFIDWAESNGIGDKIMSGYDETVEIPTLEGTMVGKPGDWLIIGVKGEVYPCKPDIFAATYEAV